MLHKVFNKTFIFLKGICNCSLSYTTQIQFITKFYQCQGKNIFSTSVSKAVTLASFQAAAFFPLVHWYFFLRSTLTLVLLQSIVACHPHDLRKGGSLRPLFMLQDAVHLFVFLGQKQYQGAL